METRAPTPEVPAAEVTYGGHPPISNTFYVENFAQYLSLFHIMSLKREKYETNIFVQIGLNPWVRTFDYANMSLLHAAQKNCCAKISTYTVYRICVHLCIICM